MEGDVWHREIDVPGLTLHVCNSVPSITHVLRAVKRQEHGLYNCVASIVHDWQFVESITRQFPRLPVVANLRCGLWYAPTPDTTAYFKSTDGHYGHWSFSTSRLNMHVATLAAQKGGLCLVDATRRGKRFPDALTKTLPIWATVINRAVASKRCTRGSIVKSYVTDSATHSTADDGSSNDPNRGQCDGSGSDVEERVEGEDEEDENGMWCGGGCDGKEWDALGVHLPPWVSANEKNEIEKRLPVWTQELQEMGVGMENLIETLEKPFKCVWVSQNDDTDDENVVEELAAGFNFKSSDSSSAQSLPFTPIIAISASRTTSRERRRLLIDACVGPSTEQIVALKHQEIPLDVMYEYVPGAGDDEESWSRGLTPTLLWEHYRELLQAGPKNIQRVAKHIVTTNKRLGKHSLRTSMQHGSAGMASDQYAMSGQFDQTSWPPSYIGTDRKISIISIDTVEVRNGASLWEEVDAVLDLSTKLRSYDEFEGEPNVETDVHHGLYCDIVVLKDLPTETASIDDGKEKTKPFGRYLRLPKMAVRKDKHGVLRHLPACVGFASYHLYEKRKVLITSDSDALDVASAALLSVLIACFDIRSSSRESLGGISSTEVVWSGPCRFYSGSKNFSIQPAMLRNDVAKHNDSRENHGNGSSVLARNMQESHSLASERWKPKFTRKSVKTYLAALTSKYYGTILGQSTLRQVYNAFLPQSMEPVFTDP